MKGKVTISSRLDKIEKLILIGSKEVLTLEECALFTNLSENYLYNLTSQKKIQYYKPRGGKIYFKKSDVQEWLLQGQKMTEAEIEAQADAYITSNRRKISQNNQ